MGYLQTGPFLDHLAVIIKRKPLETLHRPPPLLISHNWGSQGNPKKPGKIHKEIIKKYIEEQGEIHKETRKNYLKKPERIT